MSWLRNDDDMLDHAHWRRAFRLGGDGVLATWERLRSWCARRLTDGIVPADMVDEIAQLDGSKSRARALQALVDAQLLAWCDPAEDSLDLRRGDAEPSPRPRRTHDEVVIVGYLKRNPSRAKVTEERDRRAQAERLRRGTRRVTGHDSAHVPDRDLVPSQSRPNPNPVPSQDPPVAPHGGDLSPEPKAKRAKSRTKLPEDFAPIEADRSLARELGVSLEVEFPKFCDHHRGKGTLGADWRATLRYWLRNSKRFSGAARPPDDRLRAQADRVTMLRQREAAEEASRTGTR